MKNWLLILSMASCLTSCGGKDQKAEDITAANGPAPVSKNSDAFNESFGQFLSTYFEVKEGITDYDTAKANAAATQLASLADGLMLDELKNDSTGVIKATAKDYAGVIKTASISLSAEKEREKKTRAFQQVSDALYELVRIVKYDKEKLYHQHCPMAFGDEEAYWLSSSSEIVNPYLGKNHPKYKGGMIHCGDITDSLGYAK